MLKSILNFFGYPKKEVEKEIKILTSLSTFAGGAKVVDEEYWICGQKILAYVDCETNQLHKTKGSITWKTKDHNKHPFNFDSKTIYSVKVKYTKQNDRSIFPLIEVMDSAIKNEQLESLMDDFFIVDGDFIFEFDEKEKSATGDLDWLEELIFVDFYDVPTINLAKQTLSHLKEMMKNVDTWDINLKTYIAEQTLIKINNWLLNDDEYSEIDKPTLINELFADAISIYPNGNFTITYTLKTSNYGIYVDGNVSGELEKAYL